MDCIGQHQGAAVDVLNAEVVSKCKYHLLLLTRRRLNLCDSHGYQSDGLSFVLYENFIKCCIV